jgi:hypothetical protein
MLQNKEKICQTEVQSKLPPQQNIKGVVGMIEEK